MSIRCAILTVTLLTIGTTAHPAKQLTPVWISPGAGWSSSGAAAGLSFTIKPGKFIFSVRYQNNDRDALNVLAADPHETVSDFGFMIGMASIKPDGETASIALGFSSVTKVMRGDPIDDGGFFYTRFEKKTLYTSGLCLQWEIYGHGWLGLRGYANINDIETFGGLMLCCRFGNYR